MSLVNPLQPAVRAVIIRDNNVLVIKRTKPGKKYMVTPGGRIEPGEEQIPALMRELAEETGVTVKNPRLVFIEDPNDELWGMQYIYLCEYVSGEPQLHPDSEELYYMNLGLGSWEPMWFPIKDIPDKEYPFRSARVGEEIVKGFRNEFPHTPIEWQLDKPVVE